MLLLKNLTSSIRYGDGTVFFRQNKQSFLIKEVKKRKSKLSDKL